MPRGERTNYSPQLSELKLEIERRNEVVPSDIVLLIDAILRNNEELGELKDEVKKNLTFFESKRERDAD